MIDWITDFVENDDFFMTVPYTPVGGTARDLKVFFENPEFNPILAGGIKTESSQPSAFCATTDIPDITHGASLEINGKTYYVVHISDDGTGMTELNLSETPDGG